MWCPLCAREYRPGFAQCAECFIDLIASEPPRPIIPQDSVEEARTYGLAPDGVYRALRDVVTDVGWTVTVESADLRALRAMAPETFFSPAVDMGVHVVEVHEGTTWVRGCGAPEGMTLMFVAPYARRDEGRARQLLDRFFNALDHRLNNLPEVP